MFEDDNSAFAAMRAGARGYVLKDTSDEEMERAILAVGSGEAIFSPAIAERMIHFFDVRPSEAGALFPELTASERNVLNLMAQGADNKTIANQLGFTIKTVRNYSSNIFSKLQVADRAQAIVKAVMPDWAGSLDRQTLFTTSCRPGVDHGLSDGRHLTVFRSAKPPRSV